MAIVDDQEQDMTTRALLDAPGMRGAATIPVATVEAAIDALRFYRGLAATRSGPETLGDTMERIRRHIRGTVMGAFRSDIATCLRPQLEMLLMRHACAVDDDWTGVIYAFGETLSGPILSSFDRVTNMIRRRVGTRSNHTIQEHAWALTKLSLASFTKGEGWRTFADNLALHLTENMLHGCRHLVDGMPTAAGRHAVRHALLETQWALAFDLGREVLELARAGPVGVMASAHVPEERVTLSADSLIAEYLLHHGEPTTYWVGQGTVDISPAPVLEAAVVAKHWHWLAGEAKQIINAAARVDRGASARKCINVFDRAVAAADLGTCEDTPGDSRRAAKLDHAIRWLEMLVGSHTGQALPGEAGGRRLGDLTAESSEPGVCDPRTPAANGQ
jgi:hypothetical protein